MSRTRSDLHHRLPGRVGDHPVEEPGLERQSLKLIDQVVGVGSRDGVVRRPDVLVTKVRSLGDHRVAINWHSGGSLVRDRAQEMDPARILLPGTSFELAYQRFRALRHPNQARLDLTPVGEAVQPLGAGAQLPRRLLAPEQQHREERPLVELEPEVLIEDLVVLQRPSTGGRPHDPQQTSVLERPRSLLDGLQVQVDDGVAIVRLVAGRATARSR